MSEQGSTVRAIVLGIVSSIVATIICVLASRIYLGVKNWSFAPNLIEGLANKTKTLRHALSIAAILAFIIVSQLAPKVLAPGPAYKALPQSVKTLNLAPTVSLSPTYRVYEYDKMNQLLAVYWEGSRPIAPLQKGVRRVRRRNLTSVDNF